MPLESRILMEPGEDLLTICLDVHMSNMGSSDPLAPEVMQRYLTILRTALAFWTESKRTELFDTAVRRLIVATLEEDENSRS